VEQTENWKTHTDKTHNKYNETTIMKSDSGRGHRRKMIGIFWFYWGYEDILRELVIK